MQWRNRGKHQQGSAEQAGSTITCYAAHRSSALAQHVLASALHGVADTLPEAVARGEMGEGGAERRQAETTTHAHCTLKLPHLSACRTVHESPIQLNALAPAAPRLCVLYMSLTALAAKVNCIFDGDKLIVAACSSSCNNSKCCNVFARAIEQE